MAHGRSSRSSYHTEERGQWSHGHVSSSHRHAESREMPQPCGRLRRLAAHVDALVDTIATPAPNGHRDYPDDLNRQEELLDSGLRHYSPSRDTGHYGGSRRVYKMPRSDIRTDGYTRGSSGQNQVDYLPQQQHSHNHTSGRSEGHVNRHGIRGAGHGSGNVYAGGHTRQQADDTHRRHRHHRTSTSSRVIDEQERFEQDQLLDDVGGPWGTFVSTTSDYDTTAVGSWAFE